MKYKKPFIIAATSIILYLGIGAILLRFEIIQNLPIFPGGYKIQYGGGDDEDFSTVSSDGPIIIYKNDKILKFAVLPKDTSFSIFTTEIKKSDTLQCYVDEIKDNFKFMLKDSLFVQPTKYLKPNVMLVLSDIEGNFKGFKSILFGNKVIDNNFNWTFGSNHLILVGDFFDRGLNITECLWLIYKLESEAEKQGGKVHFILGNHEIMNLRGELKYLRDKYYDNADTLKLDYEEWYSNKSELGRWLRTKNGVELVGDLLFVHAGIRADFPQEYSLEQINEEIRKSIDSKRSYDKQKDDNFIGNKSPLWYRGIANEDEGQNEIESTLARYRSTKMIIGHTIMNKIKFLYNERVLAIDLDHKDNSDKNKMYALWIENGAYYVTNQNGKKITLAK